MKARHDGRVILKLFAAAGIGFDVEVEAGHAPARRARHRGEAAHAARQPEAAAAGIGLCGDGTERDRACERYSQQSRPKGPIDRHATFPECTARVTNLAQCKMSYLPVL